MKREEGKERNMNIDLQLLCCGGCVLLKNDEKAES